MKAADATLNAVRIWSVPSGLCFQTCQSLRTAYSQGRRGVAAKQLPFLRVEVPPSTSSILKNQSEIKCKCVVHKQVVLNWEVMTKFSFLPSLSTISGCQVKTSGTHQKNCQLLWT